MHNEIISVFFLHSTLLTKIQVSGLASRTWRALRALAPRPAKISPSGQQTGEAYPSLRRMIALVAVSPRYVCRRRCGGTPATPTPFARGSSKSFDDTSDEDFITLRHAHDMFLGSSTSHGGCKDVIGRRILTFTFSPKNVHSTAYEPVPISPGDPERPTRIIKTPN
ncbi:hypothetical protein PENANT_c030G11191 [Penicillium antarcticum]|uniref:Uncharacterized protein n=1 Tax=Penicillium antarcticum TaxID=416450 RepID=A0A1V6PX01_9EURO|nr:hypothetical protein PENANT_c030G11191 [Penicillium antarcticum]